MKKPRHTVIYTHGGGRLGNQVVRFVHWIAWARSQAEGVEVLNLAFWPHADSFAVWRSHPGCVYPVRPGWADRFARWRAALPRWLSAMLEKKTRLPRIVQAAGEWLPGWQAISLDIVREECADLDDPAISERIQGCSFTTFCGWRIASWDRVAEQQAELRELFRPVPEVQRIAVDFINRLRVSHDVIIGVLIRQSDYREWHEGRFLFATSQYAVWMRQLLDLHVGRRIGFVVVSEVFQDPQELGELPVHFATGTPNLGGKDIESWVELSLCDFIVSPPSTFAATAAFLGARPLWPVVAAEQEMSFDQIIPDGMIGAARHPVFSLAVK